MYKKCKVAKLTDDHLAKRVVFGRWWRQSANKKCTPHIDDDQNRIPPRCNHPGRSCGLKPHPIMFSDEKIFTIEGGHNSQNHRVHAFSRDQADEIGGKSNRCTNNSILL
jgi:hypothetical protein